MDPSRSSGSASRHRPRRRELGTRGSSPSSAARPPPPRARRAPTSPRSTSFICRRAPTLEEALDALPRVCAEVRAPIRSRCCRSRVVPNDSLWSRARCGSINRRRVATFTLPRRGTSRPATRRSCRRCSTPACFPITPISAARSPAAAGQIWTNRVEATGVAGIDDDGNGYVDDLHGWDFVDLRLGDRRSSGRRLARRRTTTRTTTRVTARRSRGWSARSRTTASASRARRGTCGSCRFASAGPPTRIRWAWSTCRSWRRRSATPRASAPTSSTARSRRSNLAGLFAAAAAATRAGVTIVAAAGNNGQFHDLADREDVIAVAATTHRTTEFPASPISATTSTSRRRERTSPRPSSRSPHRRAAAGSTSTGSTARRSRRRW